jgi:tRNA-dihydrouridine synthase 3
VNHTVDGALTAEDVKYPCLDLSTSCPIFAEAGECRYGLKCRFLGGHVHTDDKGELVSLVDEHKKAQTAVSCSEANFASPETLKLLRSRKVGAEDARFCVANPLLSTPPPSQRPS